MKKFFICIVLSILTALAFADPAFGQELGIGVKLPLQIFAALRVSVLALEAGIPLGWGEEPLGFITITNFKLYGLRLEILAFSLKSFIGGGTFITTKITPMENKNILALKLKPYGLGGLELSLFNFSLFGEVGFPPVFTNLGARYDF